MLPSGENLENFVKYSSLQGKHKKKTVIFPEFRGGESDNWRNCEFAPREKSVIFRVKILTFDV